MNHITKQDIKKSLYSLFNRRKTIYFKVFMNYALMIIGITALLGTIFYYIFSSIYVKEVSNANKYMLDMEGKIINEKVVDYVKGFSVKLIMDPSWSDIQYFFDFFL
jgi:hypothetical protein